ncbi:hypothetical protein Syun_016816 [Stephania yunnanensis]|uniref:Uncharacterized protein n=1 Tax=Stephania yunnanensis TaxID=152371 RepID=A0AAP0P2S8_9MAGN
MAFIRPGTALPSQERPGICPGQLLETPRTALARRSRPPFTLPTSVPLSESCSRRPTHGLLVTAKRPSDPEGKDRCLSGLDTLHMGSKPLEYEIVSNISSAGPSLLQPYPNPLHCKLT